MRKLYDLQELTIANITVTYASYATWIDSCK